MYLARTIADWEAWGRILGLGGRPFSTHFNGFLILARNLFAGGLGCKTIVLKGLQNNRRLACS